MQTFQGPSSASAQGRSVREYEDQMSTLRKENFNLKLRLYFLEESNLRRASDSTEDKELLKKQMIDSKVELELLRKEVQEKQELLNEAAEALAQMQSRQHDSEANYQDVIDDLKQQIFYYEMEREAEKSQCNDQQINETPSDEQLATNFNVNLILSQFFS